MTRNCGSKSDGRNRDGTFAVGNPGKPKGGPSQGYISYSEAHRRPEEAYHAEGCGGWP